MQATAILKFIRISPQKGRLVADQIRGLSVARALELLEFSDKKAARPLRKVLESAIANAENNEGADVDELRVLSVEVDHGPTDSTRSSSTSAPSLFSALMSCASCRSRSITVRRSSA